MRTRPKASTSVHERTAPWDAAEPRGLLVLILLPSNLTALAAEPRGLLLEGAAAGGVAREK